MLKFEVKGQTIETLSREPIADDQVEFVRLKFVFDAEWKTLHKIVQFVQEGETFDQLLGTENNTCTLPSGLGAGVVKMSLVGYDVDDCLRATTIPVTLTIQESGFDADSEVPPSPDLYAQLLWEMERRVRECADTFSVDFRIEDGIIQWRSGETWYDLMPLDELRGADGRSAYDVWLDEGNEGSAADFLASLVGATGFSPTVETSKENGVTTITITDIDGEHVAQISDGTSIHILGTLKSTADLPTTGNENGDCYVIDGDLYVYTGEGFDDVGQFKGDKGDTGDSAYDLAVQEGFSGSLEEWLMSLKGEKGDSAYQVWLDDGHTGSVDDYLGSLKGETGERGETGEKGDAAQLEMVRESGGVHLYAIDASGTHEAMVYDGYSPTLEATTTDTGYYLTITYEDESGQVVSFTTENLKGNSDINVAATDFGTLTWENGTLSLTDAVGKKDGDGAIFGDYENTATGEYAEAHGCQSCASGQCAMAIGDHVEACAHQVVLGAYNMPMEDALLVVGNGNDEEPSNAMVLNTSGDLTLARNLYAQNFADSGWIDLVRTDSFTAGTVQYRRIGDILCVRGIGMTTATQLNAGASVDVATVAFDGISDKEHCFAVYFEYGGFYYPAGFALSATSAKLYVTTTSIPAGSTGTFSVMLEAD